MGGRGSSSGRRSATERRNRVDVQAGQLVQGEQSGRFGRLSTGEGLVRRGDTVATPRSAEEAREQFARMASRTRAATSPAPAPARTARTTPAATPQQRTATQRKPRLTQARAQSAAEASFPRSSWDVMDVRKSNGTWTVFVSKKAYGKRAFGYGYEARGEVRNGRILNDEMGMGEKALDFARRTGAKKVVVIGYAD